MSAPDSAHTNDLLNQVLAHLRVVRGPDARGEHVCWCPFHPDGQGKAPHRPNLHVSERGFICFACNQKGSLRKLAKLLGIDSNIARPDPEAVYDYRDEQGRLLFQVVRLPGKVFPQRRPDGAGGWVSNLRGVRRVLYRLPDLLARPKEAVFVVEGEKDVDRLASQGLLATTNPGGAGRWRPEYTTFLQGRDVIVIPDNDPSGHKHAREVADSLTRGGAGSVKLLELRKLPYKGDVSDWLDAGHTVEELKGLAAAAPLWQPQAPGTTTPPANGESGRRQSQADQLVALAESDGVVLFHDEVQEPFARVPVGGHWEIWRVRGKHFRRWLAGRFWQSQQKAPNTDAVAAALNVIEAKAQFDGAEHHLHNRVAQLEGAIWYDLADAEWRAVKITPQGWQIVAHPPILFRRYSHQQAQVEPQRGGDLRELLRFVNLPKDSPQQLLLLTCVVCCLVPEIAHPILVLHGPQGSAKTTQFRILRRLVDPSAVEVLSFPRDAAELAQQLSHHHAAYYDNITDLPGWVSDALCRAVTGEGFSKRQLYTDDEDVIYHFRRCLGLNGVNVAADKPDLLDRCILVGLEPIDAASRRPEEAIWNEFEKWRPLLVGAIFDALSAAMRLRDSVQLAALPRMADFALWGCAVAEALGYNQAAFLAALEANTQTRNEEALQASLVAPMVLALLEEHPTGTGMWSGTPSALLAELERLAGAHRVNTKASAWPKAPHILSRRLNDVRPNLAAVGIQVTTERHGQRRLITIQKTAENSVRSVTSVTGGTGAAEGTGSL